MSAQTKIRTRGGKGLFRLINKYRRMHQTDLGCVLAAAAFFLVALVVITVMLTRAD